MILVLGIGSIIQKKEDKTYFNGYFKYEDYELEGINLAFRTEERNHYQGDTLVVFASGTDENDLKLLDARLEVLVRPTNIHEYHDPIVFMMKSKKIHANPQESI